jgi:type I restriction enzyme S subunit
MSKAQTAVKDAPARYSVSVANAQGVPPGYKQTEVGVIPTDWRISTVGQEFEIQLGKMLDAEKNIGTPKPYLGNKAVQWGRVHIDDLPTMAMSRSDLDRFRLRRGDLLVCEGGEVGRAAIWDAPLEECYFQKALHRLRPTRGFNTHLMLALLKYWSDHGMLSDYVSQTSIAHLTREKLAVVPISVPSAAEQRAIAAALSNVDALIAALDKLIAKKRAIKTAAMQQLLTGKQRLPGFSGEWDRKKLADLVENRKELFDDGDWIEAEYITESGIRLIQTGNIGEGIFLDKESKKYISEDSYQKLRCKEVKVGDLLICRLAEPAGRACIMPDIGERKMITAVDVSIFRPLSKYANPKFLVQLFSTQRWFEEIGLRCGGSTRSRIARGALGRMELIIPPIEEQTAIATILSDMDAEIAALEARRDKTQAIKQGMMQELLTGRTRLV